MAGRKSKIAKAELDGSSDMVEGVLNVLSTPKAPLSGTMPGVNKPGTEGDELPMLEFDAFQWHLRRVQNGRTVSNTWQGAEREASIAEYKRRKMERYWKLHRQWKDEIEVKVQP